MMFYDVYGHYVFDLIILVFLYTIIIFTKVHFRLEFLPGVSPFGIQTCTLACRSILPSWWRRGARFLRKIRLPRTHGLLQVLNLTYSLCLTTSLRRFVPWFASFLITKSTTSICDQVWRWSQCYGRLRHPQPQHVTSGVGCLCLSCDVSTPVPR